MKKLLIIVAILGVGFVLFTGSNPPESKPTNKKNGPELTKVASLQDIHGLAVDVADSSKVWLASHTGLHLLRDDTDLFVVGTARDDYMGLSADPNDPDVFYTSGHPAKGGNLGIQKTNDSGLSWQKLSDGVNGPVDFHAMAVSQIDPNIIYGFYNGVLQKSLDNGKNWSVVKSDLPNVRIIRLATDNKEKNTVYAATSGGLYISRDQGKSWQPTSQVLANDAVISLAINPKNNQEMLVYAKEMGLVKTNDGGKTWLKQESALASSIVLALGYDKNKPNVIYGVNQNLEIYKTTDSSTTWFKIR